MNVNLEVDNELLTELSGIRAALETIAAALASGGAARPVKSAEPEAHSDWLTLREIMSILKVSANTVQRMAREGTVEKKAFSAKSPRYRIKAA